jgi:malonyl-CoA O-methyltransferase
VADPGRPVARIDARLARRRFERAAATYTKAARLEAEAGARMLERLDYVKLSPRRVLDAGSGPRQRHLQKRYPDADIVDVDFSVGMLRAGAGWRDAFRRRIALCADLARLPVAPGAVDLLWSNMALLWSADLPATLREFHRVLAVDGLLMFSTLGPDTLQELREAAGSARVHAFADMHDLGDMLVGAGFAAPVMDTERVTLVYGGSDALLADLRATGQACALADAPRGLAGRRFRAALEAGLAARMREGKLPVTFEIVYGHAWKAPLKRAADGRAIVQFERRP